MGLLSNIVNAGGEFIEEIGDKIWQNIANLFDSDRRDALDAIAEKALSDYNQYIETGRQVIKAKEQLESARERMLETYASKAEMAIELQDLLSELAKEQAYENIKFYQHKALPAAEAETIKTVKFLQDLLDEQTIKNLDKYSPGWRESLAQAVVARDQFISEIEQFMKDEYPEIYETNRDIVYSIAEQAQQYLSGDVPPAELSRFERALSEQAVSAGISDVTALSRYFVGRKSLAESAYQRGVQLASAFEEGAAGLQQLAQLGAKLELAPYEAWTNYMSLATGVMPQRVDIASLYGAHLQNITGVTLYNPVKQMGIQANIMINELQNQAALMQTQAKLRFQSASDTLQASMDRYAADMQYAVAREQRKRQTFGDIISVGGMVGGLISGGVSLGTALGWFGKSGG